MTTTARALPLLTVLMWALTLVAPLLHGANGRDMSVSVASHGGPPLDLTAASLPFVLAWVAVLACAVTAWVVRSLRWWSVAAVVSSLALAWLLVTTVRNPPILLWDGVDGQGNPTGGMVAGEPTVGVLLWVVGIAALAVAGVLGFCADPPRPTPRGRYR